MQLGSNLKNKVIVIDNFIDKDYQDEIQGELLNASKTQNEVSFPWFYAGDVTAGYEKDSQHRPGFSHRYVDPGKVVSTYHELFIPLLQKVGVKLNVSNLEIILGRSFLQCPINTDGTVDTPHIDVSGNESFIVALYYVCDSDGDTIIYNERKEQPEGQYTIKQKVTPKKGRIVIFDGCLYHTAEQPVLKNTRCVVNYCLQI